MSRSSSRIQSQAQAEAQSQSEEMNTTQMMLMFMRQLEEQREERRRQEEECREERRRLKEERQEERRRQEEERQEERRRQEEERREEQMRFSQLLLEMKRSSEETQAKLLLTLESQNYNVGTSSGGQSRENNIDCELFQSRFDNMQGELHELLLGLDSQISNDESYHEVETSLERCDLALNSLRKFVNENILLLKDEQLKMVINESFKKISNQYYSESPRAKRYVQHLKKMEDAERHAGPLPPNVELPLFYGNILSFPTFWDSFEPLVHHNSNVSKFYKLKYLKDAMRGNAFGILDSYELVADNYEAAVSHIQHRWAKPEAMTKRLISSLLEKTKASDDFKG